MSAIKEADWLWTLKVAADAGGVDITAIRHPGRGTLQAVAARRGLWWFLRKRGFAYGAIAKFARRAENPVYNAINDIEKEGPEEVTSAVRLALEAAYSEREQAKERAEKLRYRPPAVETVTYAKPPVGMGEFGTIYGRRSASGGSSLHLKTKEEVS